MAAAGLRRGNNVIDEVRALDERAEHHIAVHIAVDRVIEGLGQGADNVEAKLLPERYGASVGRDDVVELHGAEAALFCPDQ